VVEIRVLGCYGSQLPGFNTTSFLLDGTVLVDAGTVVSVLTVEEQLRIDHVLITHVHLDHVRDLMFLADNINLTARSQKPIEVASTPGIIHAMQEHLFNGVIWPDFSSIPTRNNPIISFEPLPLEVKREMGRFVVMPFTVSHTIETVGYLIEFDGGSIIFVGDTGPTNRLWEIARAQKDLKAIFIETSFDDSLQDIADRSGHLTPASLDMELKKLGRHGPDIYLFHMKPQYDLDRIRDRVAQIKSRNIRILKDGDVIKIN
jgi:ribonuclease BN (tRNA processing enzyme)